MAFPVVVECARTSVRFGPNPQGSILPPSERGCRLGRHPRSFFATNIGCRTCARHRGVGRCAPRSRPSEAARCGARGRLALDHACATNAVALAGRCRAFGAERGNPWAVASPDRHFPGRPRFLARRRASPTRGRHRTRFVHLGEPRLPGHATNGPASVNGEADGTRPERRRVGDSRLRARNPSRAGSAGCRHRSGPQRWS